MSDLPAIGITMFTTDRSMPPAEIGREVEARGFASLFLPEHSHIPVSRKTHWPGARPGHNDPLPDYYWHLNDQMISLAMIGAVTERIELGTAVTLIAQHDPIWLAKQIATLDYQTKGRVVLGAGFGWNREQGEDHGVEFDGRRLQTEDCIRIMRTLWTDEQASYQGELMSLPAAFAYPKPWQKRGPPIIMGGGHGPVLFDAIARYADGWMPITGRSSISDRLDLLKKAFEKAGRDPASIEVVIAGATTDPDSIINLGKEGVGRILLTIWSEDRDEILTRLDEFEYVLRDVGC